MAHLGPTKRLEVIMYTKMKTVMMKTALISFLFAFEYVHTSILASAELRVSAVLGTSSWV